MNICIWRIGLFLCLAGPDFNADAGIAFDGSLGPQTSLSGPIYTIPAAMGRQVGGNLFHSFSQFNLVNGETADFTATGSTGSISNIIARVTGGASSINGTITSNILGANLFLFNPAGLMFGANARVNLSGAFTTGTADYLKLADGVGKFNTSLGGDDMLTSAAVSAFGFVSNAPQAVQFNQSHLGFPSGSNFSVIGGDITLTGTTVLCPSGNVSFFSAKSAGELAFDPAAPSAHFATSTVSGFGNVTLQSTSKVAIDGAQGGGHIVIRGGVMVVENSSHISAANSGAATGGDVQVDAVNLSLLDNSNIITSATSTGDAGKIAVTAQSLTVDGVAAPTSNVLAKAGFASYSAGGGGAGDITVVVTDAVSVANSGEIASDTFSAGNAGNVDLQAQTLTIDGSATPGYFTGITSTTYHGATGQGGNVGIIATGAVSILGGAEISADTVSAGHAGTVTLHAASLTIDGSALPNAFTGISSASDTGASNDGGSIELAVGGDIIITAGGEVSTATHSSGNAGDIDIVADSLAISGSPAANFLSGITSATDSTATGHGGNISLTIAGNILMTDAGEISADTSTAQPGGNIILHAGSMTIDGSATTDLFTGISSSSESTQVTGKGGNINVDIDGALICTGGGGIEEQAFAAADAGTLNVTVGGSLSLTNGGFISGDTFGDGNGGTVTVTAPSIYIDAAGPQGMGTSAVDPTGIVSDSNSYFSSSGTGKGGSVTVTAPQSLTIVNGGEIAALTETQGNGGDVFVNAPGTVNLDGIGSQISSSSSNPGTTDLTPGTAGTVTLQVGTLNLSDQSRIATFAAAANAGSINLSAADAVNLRSGSSLTTSAGIDGGAITLKVGHLVYLLDSTITASAQGGAKTAGGDITIDPQFVVLDHSLIDANDLLGTGGNITIVTDNYLNNQSLITATGSTNGTIVISSPNLDLSGSLVGLPAGLVNDQNRLRERCATSLNHEFSTLIVVGRGGTESAPEELQPDFGMGSPR